MQAPQGANNNEARFGEDVNLKAVTKDMLISKE